MKAVKGCGFCVLCNMGGEPHRMDHKGDVVKRTPFENIDNKELQRFHFGFCADHNRPVAVFRAQAPTGHCRRHTLLIEGNGLWREIYWTFPDTYDRPALFFICPGAQRLECDHLFLVLLQDVDKDMDVEFLLRKSGLDSFFIKGHKTGINYYP